MSNPCDHASHRGLVCASCDVPLTVVPSEALEQALQALVWFADNAHRLALPEEEAKARDALLAITPPAGD